MQRPSVLTVRPRMRSLPFGRVGSFDGLDGFFFEDFFGIPPLSYTLLLRLATDSASRQRISHIMVTPTSAVLPSSLPEVRHSILGLQQLAESGDDGGLRLANRRQRLMVFPAAAQRLEEIDEVVGRRRLRDGVLFLEFEFGTLGVEDIQEVGEAAIIAFGGEGHGPLARGQGTVQLSQAVLLSGILGDGRVDLLDRPDDRLLVVEEEPAGTQVSDTDHGVKRAEIQDRPGDRWADRPDEAACSDSRRRLQAGRAN